MNPEAKKIIDKLDLKPLPIEGGWFNFHWESDITISNSVLDNIYTGDRKAGTVIYYLLNTGEVSKWHKLKSDELWFWHAGNPLKMRIGGSGEKPKEEKVIILGNNILNGELLFNVVPRDLWQTSEIIGEGYVLVSCVVIPGYRDDDVKFLEE